jgi:hypothetical protein
LPSEHLLGPGANSGQKLNGYSSMVEQACQGFCL